MSVFSQSESLTHSLSVPNIMEMSSALVGPNISPRYISITFAPLHFRCNYICHNLSQLTARMEYSATPRTLALDSTRIIC